MQERDYRVAQNQQHYASPWAYLINNNNFDHVLSINRVHANSDKFPEYLPKSKNNRDLEYYHAIKNGKTIKLLNNSEIISSFQKVSYRINRNWFPKKERVSLPFYIYHRQNYQITVNGKKQNFKLSENRRPQVLLNKEGKSIVTVCYVTPKDIIFMRYLSLVVICVLLITLWVEVFVLSNHRNGLKKRLI